MEASISLNVNDLISSLKNTPQVPRYKIINGQRIKIEEYNNLENQEKENLLFKDEIDYSVIDDELYELDKEWKTEIDPVMKQILSLKYDLIIFQFFHHEEDVNLITELTNHLNDLTKLLKK
jgi:hypothetical protein